MTIRLIMLFSQAFKCIRLEYYANYHHCISGCLPPANFFIPPGILDPAEDVYRPEESITFSCSSEYNFFGISLSTCSEADGFIFPGTDDNVCLQGRCFFFLFCIHPNEISEINVDVISAGMWSWCRRCCNEAKITMFKFII